MHCVKGALVNPAMKKDEQLTQYMQIYIGQCSIVLNVSSVCILFIYFIAVLFQYVYVNPIFLMIFKFHTKDLRMLSNRVKLLFTTYPLHNVHYLKLGDPVALVPGLNINLQPHTSNLNITVWMIIKDTVVWRL